MQDFSSTLRGVDIVIDTLGGEYTLRSLRTLRKGGILVSLLPMDPDFPVELARELNVRTARLLVEPDYAGMQAIASLVNQGRLLPLIDTTVPLAKAAQAHQRGETNRATGKIVLSVIDRQSRLRSETEEYPSRQERVRT